MVQHVIFTAPFFMEATNRFIAGAAALPGIRLSLISQDPLERLPSGIAQRLTGHWRVADALDPAQIVAAAQHLAHRHGAVSRMIASLEQLQVPLAVAREQLGLPGLSVEAALNFRDKARMKTVLSEAGVPCARHALVGERAVAEAFAGQVGFPMVVKPPAGAGGKSTFRVESPEQLAAFLDRHPPHPDNLTLFEEFVRGDEYSFDSVCIDGKMVWHSISRYLPSPLEVMENDWIQWCVMLPRDISGAQYDPIREAAGRGLEALGMHTGLSHMEWFELGDGRLALSEVGARPPGAQITSLLSYVHDMDFYQAWPGLMVFDRFEPPPRHYAAGAAYFRGQGRGRVKRIHGLDEAQRRFGSIVMEAKLPSAGQLPSDSYEGDGYVIVRHPESDVVEQALREIVQLIRVELA